jgi:hypothetical protein
MALGLRGGDQRGVFLSILAVAALSSLALGGLVGRFGNAGVDRLAGAVRPEPTLSERLAGVDGALARQDLDRAIHGWRDAFSVALGSRRWEPMADVGDAALRIDARTVRPGNHQPGFRAEARRAYIRALFRARAERSADGIGRVTDAFARMGDSEVAAQARAMLVKR